MITQLIMLKRSNSSKKCIPMSSLKVKLAHKKWHSKTDTCKNGTGKMAQ